MKKKIELAIWAITFLPFFVYLIIYNLLGDTISVSWNAYGETTEYITKSLAIFMIPLISIFVSYILYFIKKISKKKHLKIFTLDYNVFFLFVSILMAFVTMFPLYLVAFDGGNTYNVMSVTLLIVAFFVLVVGFIFPQFKYEGKYGFITPWTKASEKVYYKTQQVASATFVIGALFLGGLTLFMEEHMLLAVLTYSLIMLLLVFIPLMYSKKYYENN